MARQHTFKVSEKAGATEHEVTIRVPTFEDATEEQKRAGFEKGIRTLVIDTQRPLRVKISKGTKGEALNAAAQTAFNNALAGVRAASGGTILDATALKLTREQIDLMTAQGATVVNIPAKLAGK